ncbi:14937_t:CDS:2, partial [Rhizophagus irregularis]
PVSVDIPSHLYFQIDQTSDNIQRLDYKPEKSNSKSKNDANIPDLLNRLEVRGHKLSHQLAKCMKFLLIHKESLAKVIFSMDNYHDDNVYVYENEAENRMPSPDNNVENDFYEDEPEDSPLKEIYSGQTFTSFEILEQSLKRYASQKGFEIRVVRSEKEDNVWTRKTYKCHHGGKYIPKKKVDPTQTRDRESIRIECGFLVNASYRKCQNLVFVNKFVSEHNHELQNGIDLQEFSPLLRKIPDNIVEEIQFYVQECHLEANSGNSLCQLHSGIELRLKDEAKYARWQEFRNMNPTTGMPRVSDTIFRNVDEICKKYLTPNSLALQRKQMVESLLYRTWIKEVENIYLLDSNRYDEGFVEDDYEEPQILINMALEACSNGIVNEIWEVRHLQSTKNRSQFVIILDDGSHYCTCLYLIYAGFVCRYFFAVMLQSKIAQFNIKLIPSRWYSKEGLSVMDKIQENSIQLIQDGEQRTGTFYTLNIIRGQEVYNEFIKNLDSKKEIFGRGIGLCKKALNLAIASNSHQVFENLLQ